MDRRADLYRKWKCAKGQLECSPPTADNCLGWELAISGCCGIWHTPLEFLVGWALILYIYTA